MSILINGMEIPTSCHACDMLELSGVVGCNHAYDTKNSVWGRALNCPLVEVPDDVKPVKHGKLYNNHEVACILADAFGDTCACNFNGNDEWLPFHCDFANTCCPEPVGVACWEQYLKHRDKRVVKHDQCRPYPQHDG